MDAGDAGTAGGTTYPFGFDNDGYRGIEMPIKELIKMLENAGKVIGEDSSVYICDDNGILRVPKDLAKIYEDIVVIEMGGTQ